MFAVFKISGSALMANSQRMNAVASNIANANSVSGPDGQPYRARQVVFQMQPLGDAHSTHPIGGVRVSGVVESKAPFKRVYDPGNPMADGYGYVNMPNVDVVAETVNMIAASRSYQANVEVINTAKTLMNKTLSIGQS